MRVCCCCHENVIPSAWFDMMLFGLHVIWFVCTLHDARWLLLLLVYLLDSPISSRSFPRCVCVRVCNKSLLDSYKELLPRISVASFLRFYMMYSSSISILNYQQVKMLKSMHIPFLFQTKKQPNILALKVIMDGVRRLHIWHLVATAL